MSRIMNVGLRPLRVGKFSTLVRPKNLLLLGGLFLLAVGILIFGLMQGSFSVPASEVGRALFAPENVSTDARYIVQDIRLPSHHGIAMRGHVRYGGGRDAIHCA